MQRALPLLVAIAVAGCQAGVPGAPGGTGRKPTVRATATPGPVATPTPGPGGGPGIATDAPAASATLAGRLLLPGSLAAIVSNNGGTVISDHGGGVVGDHGGGYRLAAEAPAAEGPVAGARVTLSTADGKPVLGPDGAPLVATTDAEGRWAFTAPLPAGHLVVEARKDEAGDAVRGVVAPGADRRAVALDLASTLTTGYILDRYVNTQADPVATLAKLPAANAAQTRAAARTALDAGKIPTPASLALATIVAAADALRDADAGFDAEMEAVRKLLVVAGQADLGTGLPALQVALQQVHGLLPAADGSLYVYNQYERRIRRITPQGLMATAIGKGTYVPGPLDGVLGTEAGIGYIEAVTLDAQGRLLLLDEGEDGDRGTYRAVRLGADGRLRALPGLTGPGFPGAGDLVYGVTEAAADGRVTLYAVDAAGRRDLHVFDAAAGAGFAGATAGGLDAQGRLVLQGGVGSRDAVLRIDLATFAVETVWVEPPPKKNSLGLDAPSLFVDAYGHAFLAPHLTGYGGGAGAKVEAIGPGGTTTVVADLSTFDTEQRGVKAVAQGPDGRLWVGTYGGQVYRIDGGRPVLYAGVRDGAAVGGDAGAIAFEAYGLAVLPTGELVLAGDGKLFKVGADGKTTAIPTGIDPDEDFGEIGADAAGNLYGEGYDVIWKIDGKGGSTDAFRIPENDDGTEGGKIREFFVAPDGTLTVSWSRFDPDAEDDADDDRLERVAPDGTRTPVPAGYFPPDAYWMFNDRAGQVYTYDERGHVWKLGGASGPVAVAPGGDAFDTEAGTFAVDAKGRIYGASQSKVWRLDPATGRVTPFAGAGTTRFGGTGVDDSLDQIGHLVFDGAGNLYINDASRKQIKKIPAASLD